MHSIQDGKYVVFRGAQIRRPEDYVQCKHLPVTVKKVISKASELEQVAFILKAFFYSSKAQETNFYAGQKILKYFYMRGILSRHFRVA